MEHHWRGLACPPFPRHARAAGTAVAGDRADADTGDGPARRSCSRRLLILGAGAYSSVFGLTLWQARRGQPLTAPDGLTLSALAAVLMLVRLAPPALLAPRADARGSGRDGRARTATTGGVVVLRAGSGRADRDLVLQPDLNRSQLPRRLVRQPGQLVGRRRPDRHRGSRRDGLRPGITPPRLAAVGAAAVHGALDHRCRVLRAPTVPRAARETRRRLPTSRRRSGRQGNKARASQTQSRLSVEAELVALRIRHPPGTSAARASALRISFDGGSSAGEVGDDPGDPLREECAF